MNKLTVREEVEKKQETEEDIKTSDSILEKLVNHKPLSFVMATVLGILLFLIDYLLRGSGNTTSEL